MREAHGKTWRLTVDYQALNKVTLITASVVAKYPEHMAAITGGAKWFSVLDLYNPFLVIPLYEECWE